MKVQYDFTEGKRGPVVSLPGSKTRITIRLDSDVIEWFRSQVDAAGGGNYQTLINEALKEHVRQHQEPLEVVVRRIVREELQSAR